MTVRPTKNHPIVATSSRIVYENPWLRLREDKTLRADDVEGIYGVVETKDSVVTVALSEHGEVYLIYAYSYPTDTWSWQVPGGGTDDESPVVAAERELLEETGIRARNFELCGNLIVSCGLLKERMAVVMATGLSMGERPDGTDDADSIESGKFVSFDEVWKMIQAGDICDSQSISALYLAEKWKG